MREVKIKSNDFKLTEQIQFANREILWYLLFDVQYCVLNVESNDFARWQLVDWFM